MSEQKLSLEELDKEWDEVLTKMQPKGWGSVAMNMGFAYLGAVKHGEEYRELHEYILSQGKRINSSKSLKDKESICSETWGRINAAMKAQSEKRD